MRFWIGTATLCVPANISGGGSPQGSVSAHPATSLEPMEVMK